MTATCHLSLPYLLYRHFTSRHVYVRVFCRVTARSCDTSQLNSRLDAECTRYVIPGLQSSSIVSSLLSRLFGSDSNNLYPYGVDPVFLRYEIGCWSPEPT